MDLSSQIRESCKRRVYCYTKMYQRYFRLNRALSLASGVSVAASTALGVAISPFILFLTVLPAGISIYLNISKYEWKAEICKYAYTSYKKFFWILMLYPIKMMWKD